MKSVFGILCGYLVVAIGCSKPALKGYEITGDVKNIKAKWVYLQVMKFDKNDRPYWPKIDSAKVFNSKFILNRDSSLTEPAWSTSISYIDSTTHKGTSFSFANKHSKGRNADFILENAKITIQGDMADKKGLSITGSKETDFIFKYNLMYPPSTENLDKKIEVLKKGNDTNALNSALAEKKKSTDGYKTFFKNVVANNSGTFMALMDLQQRSENFTPDELTTLLPLFDPKLLATPTGEKLKTYITQSRLLLTQQSFPDFRYKDQLQQSFALNDLKGKKATLIVFWASWCGPCRAEIPELKKFYATYKNQGVNIISISTDRDINDWKKALEKEKMPWANLSNLPGNSKEINTKYNINAIPSMFLLDKDNKIVLADSFDLQEVKNELAKL